MGHNYVRAVIWNEVGTLRGNKKLTVIFMSQIVIYKPSTPRTNSVSYF